ncbi:C-type lectin-like [Asterias amurensis]|uniref:C-type lectin-like n=1 Tax=Asterias amurensis TaxID=7602 RepID=UPI003AB8B53C
MGGFCLPSVLLTLFTIGMSSAQSCKPQMLCPFGWESWGGSCYKLLEGTMNWQEGKLKCQEMGWEMVLPLSTEENDYVIQLSKTAEYVWLNCNDIKTDGQWDCIPTEFLNWGPGEPNGGSGSGCAQIVNGWTGNNWNDAPCSSATPNVICKGKMATHQANLKQWRLLDSCLTGHTLREIPTSNVRACATVCDYDPRCRSFNVQHFGTGERICQLNNGTRYEADHTQFVKSKKPFTCVYGER